jgi:uncharacterized protein DUF4178
MTGESRRALGYGLLAAALGIAALMLIWLATSGAQAGGVVLGLLLMFVLAGPLAAVGAYLLTSSQREHASEQTFARKQRILDSDRLFRHELAARLRELAAVLGPRGERIGALARTAERSVGDEAAWYAAVQLTDSQIAVLKQYDDLVWERVRWLRTHANASERSITQAVAQLERAMDERTDLLVRGRQAPSVEPAALLSASTPADSATALEDIAVGDAVSRDGLDYVVEAVASSFADGQTWQLVHLVPSGPSGGEHWLEIAPGALELAWLDPVAPPTSVGAPQLEAMPLVSSGSAAVTVTTHAGEQPSVLVTYWRYRGTSRVGLVQQWPDGGLQAFVGMVIRPRELQVWPSNLKMEVSHIS